MNFQFSEHTSGIMKDKLAEQIQNMLEMFINPKDVLKMSEMTDYEGNDVFWYLDEYDLYNILDCRIMDRII